MARGSEIKRGEYNYLGLVKGEKSIPLISKYRFIHLRPRVGSVDIKEKELIAFSPRCAPWFPHFPRN